MNTPLQALASRLNRQLRAPVVRVGWRPILSKRGVPTGFAALDAATGLDGFPRGRVTELIGRATSGRSSVAAGAVANITTAGGASGRACVSGAAASAGYAAWVDVAGTLDVAYLAERGVDLARLVVLRPRAPLDAFGLVGELARAGHFDAVVLDGLADLPAGGATTEALGRFLRVIVPALARTPTALVVFSTPEHHHPALAHAAALRLAFAAGEVIRLGGVLRGWRVKVGVLKAPGHQGHAVGLEMRL